ncbi:MAG: hypothetical protein ABI559_06850 [Chloroflexota bacterium]
MQSPMGMSSIPQWWRLAGVAGIFWFVLFFVGAFVIQGDSPDSTQTLAEIKSYWASDSGKYLVSDFMISLGFVFGFVPFVVGLRWVLGSAEDGPPILSWTMMAAGLILTALGGAAGAFEGALAVASKNNISLDDSTTQALVLASSYTFATGQLAIALFIAAPGLLVARTGVIWRWSGFIALLSAPLLVIGAAWPIDGDEHGVFGAFGFFGFALFGIWVLITSIALIMRKEPPPSTERAMAR